MQGMHWHVVYKTVSSLFILGLNFLMCYFCNIKHSLGHLDDMSSKTFSVNFHIEILFFFLCLGTFYVKHSIIISLSNMQT